MLKYMAAVAIAVAVFSWSAISMAADAAREKCTCDLKDPTLNNGASVRNATACWSHEDEDHEWCDISVQAIEGDDRHQTIISELIDLQSQPEELTAYLQAQAVSASEALDVEPAFAEARNQLPVLMSQFSKLTSACIEGFVAHAKDHVPFDDIEEGAFRCRVGETTGWLRMSFQVGDIRFVYMVAPDA
ncbi:hypothetical protein MIC97_20760 [Aquamicrobium sp. NLF2-7]|uniref:hypothetical protein n=1 Tax=Aquamicrobium sp. NLF2-7 TaxID=2918753 RepID=UPI001EFB3D9E|nr:hypothetical protein [Aquamicrobium sp. NLF2-7]MCG8273918.1 hypothetical protein [Aquamicrobium sp. NLF2-7]